MCINFMLYNKGKKKYIFNGDFAGTEIRTHNPSTQLFFIIATPSFLLD